MMPSRGQVLRKAGLFALIVIVLTSSVEGRGQSSTAADGGGEEILKLRVQVFDVQEETILEGVWKLAREVPFGFGFEKLPTKKFMDPDIPGPKITLHLENSSVREVLDALCDRDGRYLWSSDEMTVNLFPRSVASDRSYLLNRKLEQFRLESVTDVEAGLFAIAGQLPPPSAQIGHVQIGGGDPYPPEPWTATFTSLTVRQVLNRLAAHGGPCGTWISGGTPDLYTFGFFNTHLGARPEIRHEAQPRPSGLQDRR
jgi:hypothetical protein